MTETLPCIFANWTGEFRSTLWYDARTGRVLSIRDRAPLEHPHYESLTVLCDEHGPLPQAAFEKTLSPSAQSAINEIRTYRVHTFGYDGLGTAPADDKDYIARMIAKHSPRK